MNANEPGTALGHALHRLRGVGQALRQQAQQPFLPQLAALQQVIDTLSGGGALHLRRCPAAYVVDWQRYLLDPQQRLSSRAVRYLCWEPAVATGERFQAYLDGAGGASSAASLQGLVWCCHTCWSPAFAAGAVARRVQQRLAAYAGDNALVLHWRQHADVLLGPSGPRDLGAAVIAERGSMAVFCQRWGIDERSPYVLAVLRQALGHCLQNLEKDPSLSAYLLTTLLPWTGWTANDFRTAIAAAVVHPVIGATPEMPEQLMKLALADARLGDPRLPSRMLNWAAVPASARQQFVQWLSAADIHFFFDQVLLESKDQAERQAFWLLYVPRILRSRPLLHTTDSARLQAVMRQMPERLGHCGRMHDASSACILDLGALVVVLLSDLRAPCYVYGKRSFEQLVPDFWQAPPFLEATLLALDHAATIPHDQKWEREVREILAQYDIRAAYKEAA